MKGIEGEDFRVITYCSVGFIFSSLISEKITHSTVLIYFFEVTPSTAIHNPSKKTREKRIYLQGYGGLIIEEDWDS